MIGLLAGGAVFLVAQDDGGGQAKIDRADDLAQAAGETDWPPITASPEPLDTEELTREFRNAVFRVDTEGRGFESGGTAFAVGDHLLVTNWHVVVTDTTPTVVAQNGEELRAEVLGWFQELDVAVLSVAETLTTKLRWARTEGLVEGQEITVMGYPIVETDPDSDEIDVTFSVTAGRLVSFVEEEGVRVGLRTDGSVDSGNSGGPALTDRGELAGVITRVEIGNNRVLGSATTRDGLGSILDDLVVAEGGMDPDCTQGGLYDDPYGTPLYEEYGERHTDYGDDPVLDALYDRCEGGDIASCTRLISSSPTGSDYEFFGSTCGTRNGSPECLDEVVRTAAAQAAVDLEATVGTCLVDGHGNDLNVSIPCDQLHELEIMASVDLPGTAVDDDEVDVAAWEECLEEFEPFVGVDYWSSELEYSFLALERSPRPIGRSTAWRTTRRNR